MKKIVDISDEQRVELEIYDGEQVAYFQVKDGNKWVTKLSDLVPTETIIDKSASLIRRWDQIYGEKQEPIKPIRTMSGYPNPIR